MSEFAYNEVARLQADGLSYSEIARMLGRSRNWVARRAHYARHKNTPSPAVQGALRRIRDAEGGLPIECIRGRVCSILKAQGLAGWRYRNGNWVWYVKEQEQ